MNNYLYVSSRKEVKEYLEDNFSNVYFIKSNPSKLSINRLLSYIKKNNIKEVIIENYFVTIDKFISKLNSLNIVVKMVYTEGLATLNEELTLNDFLYILDLLRSKKIKSLAFTEDNIYEVYKDIKGIKKIKLTVNSSSKVKTTKGYVGIIGDPFNWQSNYFNQLSAIKMLKGKTANLLDGKNISRRYTKFFFINSNLVNKKFNVKNFREYLLNSEALSCVEFSNCFDLYVLDSFNSGVPVVLGNNTLFFNKSNAFENIIVKSDDDIEEISKKIEYAINNKKEIITSYQKLKEEYDKESKKLIESFIKE